MQKEYDTSVEDARILEETIAYNEAWIKRRDYYMEEILSDAAKGDRASLGLFSSYLEESEYGARAVKLLLAEYDSNPEVRELLDEIARDYAEHEATHCGH